ncbi:IclR family transcriptional regulator [Scopulibacillus darangshiensis]|uniref:Glycerol operon regulatory protein n=1 Tax=Scopulibacillus darangshiensis TaxID=442528 RepID=A0A4R2NDF5_9BACL|nr:IclR family transcriptional regulator [Scopulibacillus darangshiensis]TCP19289.1 IclR family transcriptional regulator [Scopulibacillus darangshiensis]
MERENRVKSVDRALDIIKIVSSNKEGCGVTEIANQIDINKSSVYRILVTLAQHGFIEQDESSGKYKIGYSFLEISSSLLESIDIRSEAMPFLKELESETDEVVHLVVYDQGEVVYIEKLEGNQTLRTHSKVGRRAPMHCSAVGKAILSHQTPAEVAEIIKQNGLPKHTDYTITNKGRFLQELDDIKTKGYSLDLEENEYGIICIAVPVFDYLGKVMAAISVSGPSIRMSEDRIACLKQKIIESGSKISARLGYKK